MWLGVKPLHNTSTVDFPQSGISFIHPRTMMDRVSSRLLNSIFRFRGGRTNHGTNTSRCVAVLKYTWETLGRNVIKTVQAIAGNVREKSQSGFTFLISSNHVVGHALNPENQNHPKEARACNATASRSITIHHSQRHLNRWRFWTRVTNRVQFFCTHLNSSNPQHRVTHALHSQISNANAVPLRVDVTSPNLN